MYEGLVVGWHWSVKMCSMPSSSVLFAGVPEIVSRPLSHDSTFLTYHDRDWKEHKLVCEGRKKDHA